MECINQSQTLKPMSFVAVASGVNIFLNPQVYFINVAGLGEEVDSILMALLQVGVDCEVEEAPGTGGVLRSPVGVNLGQVLGPELTDHMLEELLRSDRVGVGVTRGPVLLDDLDVHLLEVLPVTH